MENPNSENQPVTLETMPTESLLEIIKLLKPKDMNFFKSTSRGFQNIVDDNKFWLGRVKSNFHLTDNTAITALEELKKLGHKAKPNYADLYAYCFYTKMSVYQEYVLFYLKDLGLTVEHLQGHFWLSPIQLLGLVAEFFAYKAEKKEVQFDVLLSEIENISINKLGDSVKKFLEAKITISNVSGTEHGLLSGMIMKEEPRLVEYGIQELMSKLALSFNCADKTASDYLKNIGISNEHLNTISIPEESYKQYFQKDLKL